MTTMHGLIMVFGAIMPPFVGCANWRRPMQIRAPDMAITRLNNSSFWLLPFATTLLTLSYFTPGGAPSGGYTIYAPLTMHMGSGTDPPILPIHINEISPI